MAYTRLNLMIPTRGRINDSGNKNPDGGHIFQGKLAALLQSAMEKTITKTSDVVSFTFVVNKHDTQTQDCIMGRCAGYPFQIILEDEPEPHIAKFYNMAYEQTKFNEPDRLVSMIGDDMIFETERYQDRILREVNKRDGNCFCYCNDAYIAGPNCAVNFFTTRKVVEATGKPFMKPDCQAEMMDLIWTEAANMVNIGVYLPDVVIFHNHDDKLPEHLRDETWKRMNPIRQKMHRELDKTAQQAYINEMAQALVAKGIGRIG